MGSLAAALTGFGLSAPAGLNAYLPLLVAAVAARFTTVVHLQQPFGFLASWWSIIIFAGLVGIELVVDKIPGIDTVNDMVQTPIRLAAGGILLAAFSNPISDFNVVLAVAVGVLLAGAVHAVKATSRPIITASTGGLGNPFVSLFEDAMAGLAAVLAIVVPILAVALIVAIMTVMYWGVRRVRGRRLLGQSR